MNIYLKRAIIILLVMIFIVTYLVMTLYNKNEIYASSHSVIVDAGHGAPDGGAVGILGTVEKDINLLVAKKLENKLVEIGYEVIMTRQTDDGIYVTGKTIKEKKKSDILNREKIMNSGVGEIFVSIHMNKFEESKYHGAQVFYSKNSENSKQLGELIQEALKTIDNTNNRQAKASDGSIYLLSHAQIPACIVECGFLSNEAEEKMLNDASYQDKLAGAICDGIANYFKNIAVDF